MMVLHSVFIYFPEGDNQSLIQEIETSILKDLSRIKTVKNIHAGGPLGVDRDVVDNDYGMSLHAFFNNREDMMSYQKDPIHLEFLRRFGKKWDHIKVCDTELAG